MGKKLKVYLDTSVINFLFADDAPEKKEVTIDFFENYLDDPGGKMQAQRVIKALLGLTTSKTVINNPSSLFRGATLILIRALRLNHFNDPYRRDRELLHPDSNSMIDSIGNGRDRRDHRRFTHPLSPIRPFWIDGLHNDWDDLR